MSSLPLRQWFQDGEGIAREVISADIQRYLGPDATIKPGEQEGIKGYWITAYKTLTSSQVQDLKTDSERWLNEPKGLDPNQGYPSSQTRQQRQTHGYTDSHAYPSQPAASYSTYPASGQGDSQGYSYPPNPQGYATSHQQAAQYGHAAQPRTTPTYQYPTQPQTSPHYPHYSYPPSSTTQTASHYGQAQQPTPSGYAYYPNTHAQQTYPQPQQPQQPQQLQQPQQQQQQPQYTPQQYAAYQQAYAAQYQAPQNGRGRRG